MAVMTNVTAQILDFPSTVVAGTGSGSTGRKLKVLFAEGAKATQGDWFSMTALLGNDAENILCYYGSTKNSSSVIVTESVMTITASSYMLEFDGPDTGMSSAIVYYFT